MMKRFKLPHVAYLINRRKVFKKNLLDVEKKTINDKQERSKEEEKKVMKRKMRRDCME